MKRPERIEELKREIERLQDAKRRALSLADEPAKEAAELRIENERLRARLTECGRS
jgi:regulator of replication initiation timing